MVDAHNLSAQLGLKGPPYRTQRVRVRSVQRRNAMNLLQHDKEASIKSLGYYVSPEKGPYPEYIIRPYEQDTYDVSSPTRTKTCEEDNSSCSLSTYSSSTCSTSILATDGEQTATNKAEVSYKTRESGLQQQEDRRKEIADCLEEHHDRQLESLDDWQKITLKKTLQRRRCKKMRLLQKKEQEQTRQTRARQREESKRLFWSSNQRIKDERDHRKKLMLVASSNQSSSGGSLSSLVRRTTKRSASLSNLIQSLVNNGEGFLADRREENEKDLNYDDDDDDDDDEEEVERAQQRSILASLRTRESSNLHRYTKRDVFLS